MSTTLLIIVGSALTAVVIYLALQIRKISSGQGSGPSVETVTLLQNQIAQLEKSLGDRMGETQSSMQKNSAASNTLVRDVTEKLTKLQETNKQVLDITGQLERLQDMLKNPKQRGVLGEYYLETLLKNALPPGSYQMQYGFKNGEIVDAAVFIKDKVVPVDSKFSLENYNRILDEKNATEREKLEKTFINDLKLRIKETAKYIRPEEGTMDFAFMFIPHEAIYYDLLVNKIGAVTGDTESLIQRAAGKWHVIIVSPTSFLAYLQTVLQGLKALQIEEQALEIKKRVGDLSRHLGAYEDNLQGLGKHLSTTVNKYNLASKEWTKIDKDVLRISGESNKPNLSLLDRPDVE